jgi:hypothetical protein
MPASRLRGLILGSTTAAGLALLGGGTAGVFALDGDLRAAERPAPQQRLVRRVTPVRPCPAPPTRPDRRPARPGAARVKV